MKTSKETRNHKRFPATAFLNRPVQLSPVPPHFGHAVKGRLIDLSAGGLSILINEMLPQNSLFDLKIAFPDQSVLQSAVNVKYVLPRQRRYLHGIEFLSLPADWANRLQKMSSDYIDCETRIQNQVPEICRIGCSFYTMCTKKERLTPLMDVEVGLALTFEALTKSASL